MPISRREARIQATATTAALAAVEDTVTDAADAAVVAALEVDGSISDAIVAEGDAVALRNKTVTVGHATLTDAVNGEAQSVNIGTALPAGAVVVGLDITLTTPFSGTGLTTTLLEVGTAGDPDAIVNDLDMMSALTEQALRECNGIKPFGAFSASQLIATFTPDGSHALLAHSAGAVTITVYYMVP